MGNIFWERYSDLCTAAGETPNSVAKKIGASSGSVTAWKNGSEPRNATTRKIADFFNVSTDYLLGKEENAPTKAGGRAVSDEEIQFALFGGNDEITKSMYEEVKKFAAYLKQRESYGK